MANSVTWLSRMGADWLAPRHAKKKANTCGDGKHGQRALFNLIGKFLERVATHVRRFIGHRLRDRMRTLAHALHDPGQRVIDKIAYFGGTTGKFTLGRAA